MSGPHKPIRSAVGSDERHKCRRCSRTLPYNQFAPLFDRPATKRYKGEVAMLLHPYCNRCRDQLAGKWLGHPKYSIAADTFFGSLHQRCKANAASRGIVYAIRKDDIIGLWVEQDGKCALSGIEMMLEVGRGVRNDTACSVDRLNSTGPYVTGNVHLVCGIVNIMKNDLSYSRFVALCEKIVRHQADKVEELQRGLTL